MRFWTLLIIPLFFLSCDRRTNEEQTLLEVRTIINEDPALALARLDSMKSHLHDYPQNTKMHWQLLHLTAQNKCDTVFHTDNIQKEVADYFDRHGTSNEQMMAHYLLGRAYSDMGEYPRSLSCYQKAAEKADTTSRDCDYYTLCSIYGQIAHIFDKQHMYIEEIEALRQSSYYAWKDNDIFYSIKGTELQEIPYYALDDTASCFRIAQECRQRYLKHGYTREAAQVYPVCILILLQDGQYERAQAYMQAYEQGYGLFDQDGNVTPGREHYYYSKGLYCMGVNKPDSAEYYFRKLLGSQINRNYEAYRGLLSVYENRHDMDSVMKYVSLSENALDSIQKDDQSETMAITNAMYNYHRMERIASQNELRAERSLWLMVIILLTSAISVFTIGYAIYRRHLNYKEAKEDELGRLSTDYTQAVYQYEKAREELKMIEMDKSAIIHEKQAEIDNLQKRIEQYHTMYVRLPDHEKEASLMKNQVVLSFKDMAKFKKGTPLPKDAEWNLMLGVIKQNLPSFYMQIVMNPALSTLEKHVCILTRLNFSPGEISVLLDKTPQSITNIKFKVNNKFFGDKNATSLRSHLLKM